MDLALGGSLSGGVRQQLLALSLDRKSNTIGDGFLATFDGPARAIRCALATIDANREIGLTLRAGLHTGECEHRGSDVSGIAVHIGARVGRARRARRGAGITHRQRPRGRLGAALRRPRQPHPEGSPRRLAAVRRQLIKRQCLGGQMPGAARDLAPNAQPSHRTEEFLHLAREQDAAERQLRRRAQYAS